MRLLCTAEVAQTEMDQLKPGCQHVTNSPWKMPLRKTAFANHHLHSNDLAKHFALRIWSAWQLSKRRLLQCLNGVGSISISEKNNAEKRKSWQVIILRDAQQQLSARKMFKVNKGRQNKAEQKQTWEGEVPNGDVLHACESQALTASGREWWMAADSFYTL